MNHLDKDGLKKIICDLILILEGQGYVHQATYLSQVTDLIDENNEDKLIEELNSTSFWGGSGAIWEVELDTFKEQQIIVK